MDYERQMQNLFLLVLLNLNTSIKELVTETTEFDTEFVTPA